MTSFPRMLSSWGEFDLVSDLSTFKVVSTLSDLHLQLFRLPGVQSEGPDLGQVDAQTPAGSGRPFKPAPSPPPPRRRSPVDAGTLDAQRDPQVDGGPARLRLPTVAAHLVPGAPEGHAQSRGGWPLGGACSP